MKRMFSVLFCFFCLFSFAQSSGTSDSQFWKKVQWGGTGALNFSNVFTTVSISPQAVYPINNYFFTGIGLQYSYLRNRNLFTTHLYGGSWINLFNPLPELQISTELEQLRVNTELTDGFKDDFWNTALFLGLGYSQGNFTVGVRYNVLFEEENNIYPQAWMPFVRVFF